jgi:hypothetical protein
MTILILVKTCASGTTSLSCSEIGSAYDATHYALATLPAYASGGGTTQSMNKLIIIQDCPKNE